MIDLMTPFVSDPPKFTPPPSSTAVGVEGESLTVAIVSLLRRAP
jgi:hypothetical protein